MGSIPTISSKENRLFRKNQPVFCTYKISFYAAQGECAGKIRVFAVFLMGYRVFFCSSFSPSNRSLEPLNPYRRLFTGVSQLMDNTILNLSFRKYSFNCSSESSQIIRARNKDIFHTSIAQAVQNGRPVFGALIFSNPHAKDIFMSIQINTYGDIYCLFDDSAFAANMIMNCIQKYNCINALQQPLLPLFCNWQNLIRYPANRCIRNFYTV